MLTNRFTEIPWRYSSYHGRKHTQTQLKAQRDFVFIDGSHVYEDALFDIVTWYDRLRLGGRLALHDSESVAF